MVVACADVDAGLLAEETVEHLLGDNGHLALVALEDDGLEDEI